MDNKPFDTKFLSNLSLSLRLEVDFVIPLSQEQQELQEQEFPTKIYEKEMYYSSGILTLRLKFYETYNNEQKEQVFATYSKFQIKRFR